MSRLTRYLAPLSIALALLWAAPAWAQISAWTSIGTVSISIDNGSLTTTASVPAGALILVCDNDATGDGVENPAMTDTSGNTYHVITQVAWDGDDGDYGSTICLYAYNVTALSSGKNITFTDNGNAVGAMTAAYATGELVASAPLDTGATNTAYGLLSGTGTVTSGSAAQAGETFIGVFGANSITAPTTPSGWTLALAVPSSTGLIGDAILNSGTTAQTYAQTGGGIRWGEIIMAFKPATPSGSLMFMGPF